MRTGARSQRSGHCTQESRLYDSMLPVPGDSSSDMVAAALLGGQKEALLPAGERPKVSRESRRQ